MDSDYNNSDGEIDDKTHAKLVQNVLNLNSKQYVKKPTRTEPTLNISEYDLVKSGKNVQLLELTKVLRKKGTKHGVIEKKIRKAGKKGKTLPKPLEKPQAERIRRTIGYENARLEMDKWEPIVTSNRVAQQVRFPLVTKTDLTNEKSESKWRMKSDLEKKLEEIQPKVEVIEVEPVKKYPMTLRELMEKRQESAKLRAYQSYKESKARRQNKIKSKKYHKVQRREKIKKQLKEFELLQKTDPEAALRKLDEIEKARAQERISLRHKGTGKWARNKQIRAKYDKESRQVLAQQLAISRDLTQKQKLDDDSESENEEKAVKITNSDPNNPWINSANIKVAKEVEDFVSGYRKYWEQKNNIKDEEENDVQEMNGNHEEDNESDGEDENNEDDVSNEVLNQNDVEDNISDAEDNVSEEEISSSEEKIISTKKKSNSNKNNQKTVKGMMGKSKQLKKEIVDDKEQIRIENVCAKNVKGLKKKKTKINEQVSNGIESTKKVKQTQNEDISSKKVKQSQKQNGDISPKKIKQLHEQNKDLSHKKVKQVKNHHAEEAQCEESNLKKLKQLKKATTKINSKSSNEETGLKRLHSDEESDCATKTNKKRLSGTSEWEVVDADKELMKLDSNLRKKLQQRYNVLKKELAKEEKLGMATKKIKSKSEVKNKKVDLSLPKKATKPIIDEELNETAYKEKNSDIDKIKTFLDDASTGTKSKKAVGEKDKTVQDIDPDKFIRAKKTTELQTEIPDLMGFDDNEEDVDQKDVITEAFEDDDIADDFQKEKKDDINSNKIENVDLTLPGWGSWGGKDIEVPKKKKRRFIMKFNKPQNRKDKNKGNLIIKEGTSAKLKPHLVSEVPFPFKSVKDYEASIRAPVGNTFVPENAHRRMIEPAVITKMGAIIEPLSEDVLLRKKKR